MEPLWIKPWRNSYRSQGKGVPWIKPWKVILEKPSDWSSLDKALDKVLDLLLHIHRNKMTPSRCHSEDKSMCGLGRSSQVGKREKCWAGIEARGTERRSQIPHGAPPSPSSHPELLPHHSHTTPLRSCSPLQPELSKLVPIWVILESCGKREESPKTL